MPRKHLDTSFDLILELEHVKRYGKPIEGEEHERVQKAAADEIMALIRRHVIPHAPVGFHMFAKATRDYRCSYCNCNWTEKSETYNGGCCAKDEEHNPVEALVS
jgi:hypothetical protein